MSATVLSAAPYSIQGSDFAFKLPQSLNTLKSFLDWAHSPEFPEAGKISFIDGEVLIDMSPERTDSHGQLKIDLIVQFHAVMRGQSLGRMFTDSTLIVNHEANVANEPDVVFCSWEALDSGRVRRTSHPNPENEANQLEGSPTLVAELVSMSSTDKDRVLLRERYYLAGIEEYWLIDARKKEVVKFELLIRGPKGYLVAKRAKDGSQRSDALNRWVSLARQDDGHGGSEYQFNFRPVA